MHHRSGSATLSQLDFPLEDNQNFPWEKFHWDDKAVKGKEGIKKKVNRESEGALV